MPDPNQNDPRFVEYYEQQSATSTARERARGIMSAVLRMRRSAGGETEHLYVADIGCNAGTQSACWLEAGHRISGIDISRDLINLAERRNEKFGSAASFTVGTAIDLPWATGTFDIVLLPELLEHVANWQACLREAVRVLKVGGTIYLSTTNTLCPAQHEFELPGFGWYPGWLKRHYIRKACTTDPQLANFATYPAVNWFNPYQLSNWLGKLQVSTVDRFDLIDVTAKGAVVKAVVAVVCSIPPLRLLGHMSTPGTTLIGHKRGGELAKDM